MILNPRQISQQDKSILAGLFLSKFDHRALQMLGFEGFIEAYNVIGYALGAKPALIKNYRDEFDPLFPQNGRSGWHKRSRRDHCLKVLNSYKELDIDLFASLIKSIAGFDENVESKTGEDVLERTTPSLFANRLITGLAAEQYFESAHKAKAIPEFMDYSIENTTQLGCGYDYRLCPSDPRDFLAVEVKGLRAAGGSVSLTRKEYETADTLRDRFFLLVVKDFQKKPFHELYQNPVSSRLLFRRTEKVTIQVAWNANI